MRKYRLAFVGCGFVAQQCHLPCYSSNDDFEIKYLADPVGDLRERIADIYEIEHRYESHHNLLAKQDIDAVVVTLPRKMTFHVVHDLYAKGLNVITEKPICLNYVNATKLLRLHMNLDNFLLTGYMRQHDKGVEIFKKELMELDKKEIVSVHAYCHMGNSYANPFGDKKGRNNSEVGNIIESMPAWLSEKYYWEYEQFINVFSHLTQLLEFVFESELVLKSKVIQTTGEGLLLCTIAGHPVCLELIRGEQYAWKEGIRVTTRSKEIKVTMPPAFLKNQPAVVEISQGTTRTEKHVITPEWSWAFREQTNALKRALEGKADTKKDLHRSISQVRFAESVLKDLLQSS